MRKIEDYRKIAIVAAVILGLVTALYLGGGRGSHCCAR